MKDFCNFLLHEKDVNSNLYVSIYVQEIAQNVFKNRI